MHTNIQMKGGFGTQYTVNSKMARLITGFIISHVAVLTNSISAGVNTTTDAVTEFITHSVLPFKDTNNESRIRPLFARSKRAGICLRNANQMEEVDKHDIVQRGIGSP